MLDVKKGIRQPMTTFLDATEPGGAAAQSPDPFEITQSFHRWLRDLETGKNPLAHGAAEVEKEEESEIYIGSFPGSNCEIAFEGVLHFDGYSMGNMTSPDGTLVLTKRGRIEADVNVRTAVINGCVTGNIAASERVVLESEARVTGQIHTRALSVRLGAVFDGDCFFTDPNHSFGVADLAPRRSNEFEHFAVGASA